ncbi:hypothetical protein Gotur_024089 [Gossypium turneri]
MGEAVIQIQEVADHLQTLPVQANTLSVKYELESNRGQELASLIRNIRFQKEMQDQIQLQVREQLAKIQQDIKDEMRGS